MVAKIFQSTHPSGVRQLAGIILSQLNEISIHAPQWGATAQPVPIVAMLGISIHAPQWGATDRRSRIQAARTFQSTHPSGVRHNRWCGRVAIFDFNPRTPVGCDEFSQKRFGDLLGFQSTHPSGVRRPRRDT